MIRQSHGTFEAISFDNLAELNYFISRTDNINPKAENASSEGSRSFTGTQDMKQAIKLLTGGDRQLLEKIRKAESNLDGEKLMADLIKRTYINDVVGFMPNVPNAVMGLPNDMVRSQRITIKSKIVNLAVILTTSGFVDSDDIINNALILFKAVDQLERQGYRCNVWVVDNAKRDGHHHITTVKIKDDKEPFNKLKLAFPMAHTSMARRIFFAVSERFHHWIGSGYGVPMELSEAKPLIKKVLNIDNIHITNIGELGKKGIEGINEYAKSAR